MEPEQCKKCGLGFSRPFSSPCEEKCGLTEEDYEEYLHAFIDEDSDDYLWGY